MMPRKRDTLNTNETSSDQYAPDFTEVVSQDDYSTSSKREKEAQYDMVKWFDYFIRSRELHIAIFSMTGLVLMIVSSSLLWYGSKKLCEVPGCFNQPLKYRYDTFFSSRSNPSTRMLIILIQCLMTSTTVITIILIVQKYQVKLLEKKKEWGAICTPRQLSKLLPHSSSQVYHFLQSPLKWYFLTELLIHLPHPIMIVRHANTNDAFIVTSEILMFLRLYVFLSLFHRFSDVFRNRAEIVSSNEDLRKLNYRVNISVSIKMIFYQYTSACVIVLCCLALFVFGFSIFLVERSNVVARTSNTFFGTLENSVWFAWVSISTIGYGDLVPATHIGRITAAFCTIVGISLTILLSAAWTNKIAATNQQRYVQRYLTCTKAENELKTWAVTLIQRAYREYLERCRLMSAGQANEVREVHYGHKGNLLFDAVSNFRTARRKTDDALVTSDDPSLDSQLEEYVTLIDRTTLSMRSSTALIQSTTNSIQAKLARLQKYALVERKNDTR